MSDRIEKQEIISEEGLKVFKILFDDLMKIIGKAEELKSVLKDATSLNDVANAIKKTNDNTKKLVGTTKELQSIVALGKQRLKEETAQRVAAAKKVAAIEKKKTTDLKKNIAERIAAAKRVATFEKKRMSERVAAAKRVAAFEKRITREQERSAAAAKKKSGVFMTLIKNMVSYGAAMFGIHRVIRLLTTDIFNLTKKLDSQEFAMRTVIKNTRELAATTMFLLKTSVNYGQDLLVLTERYIKFRAASQQSNMTARETMQIFDSTAKAAAVLGLKTDEVNGVFLALEQMISKGKVTTEELRRQLGERLPGAFGIMAKAMGVPIVELDKMLKAGEILSSVALPKFAIALEEAYGIESVEKVNTLASAQGRLKTSWVQFVNELKASEVYINILNGLATEMSRIRLAMGNTTEFEHYLLLQNELGDNIRAVKKEFDRLDDDALFDDLIGNQRKWLDVLEETNIDLGLAGKLFRQYAESRKQLLADPIGESVTLKPFDAKEFSKELDKVEKDAKSFSNQTSKDLKDNILRGNRFLSEGVTTYKEVLQLQEKELVTMSKSADAWLLQFEQLKTRRELTKEESKDFEFASFTAINLMEARIGVANRLAEIEKGPDDRLAIAKANNEKILALREEQFKFGESTRTFELQKEVELLKIKKKLNDNLIQFTEAGSKERAKVEADSQKIQTEITQTEAKRRAEIDEAWNKQRLQFSEDFKNERIAQIYELSDIEILEIARNANREFLNSKKTTKDKIKAKWRETLEILKIEKKAADEILKIDTLSADERAEFEEKIVNLKILLAQKGLDFEKDIEAQRIADIRDNAAQARAILNAGFEFSEALGNNALESARRRFELESALAGENKFKQLNAEKKFDKEQAKIKRRQAIANKAAAATEIIINTAVSISTLERQTGLFGLPLIPLLLGIGAAQLATVLATKIPEFEKGGKHKGGPAKMSELGPELFFPASGGKPVLTPETETITNMPAGEFKSADETQRILADQAYSQTYDMVDMSQTNSHLKSIDKNTSESINYIDGHKIVKKRGFRGKYNTA